MNERPPIYVFDIETTPFAHGREDLIPFACGLYDGERFEYTWGNDCIKDMKHYLDTLPPGIIYAHNGGKFDLFWCMEWLSHVQPLTIINGRIVRGYVWIDSSDRYHEIRDSLSIIPVKLETFGKDEIDYKLFEKNKRNKYRDMIVTYLKRDCTSLHKVVNGFWDKFGDNLTIGATSMKQLRLLHKFDRLEANVDVGIRDAYYYGGRVQCFEGGEIHPTKGNDIIAYDLNQCYPYVMHSMLHPVSVPDEVLTTDITDRTYFVTVYGRNHGAFPKRTKTGLKFDIKRDIFSVSIHEYNAAIETGMFEVEDILECVNFSRAIKFDKFVDKFHRLRKDAQNSGDKDGATFYKYVGNSAYGKFAQCPDNYFDYRITDTFTNLNPMDHADDYKMCASKLGDDGYILWRKKSENTSRYNVATGASITGGARSLIIRALANAKRPLYCDTDSIVCEGLKNVPIHPTNLGHWKVEVTARMMAIAGRKVYALFADTCPDCGKGKDKVAECDNDMFHTYGCVKKAHKGAVLTPQQIRDVANGAEVEWNKPSPTFNMLEGSMRYMSRTIRRTV